MLRWLALLAIGYSEGSVMSVTKIQHYSLADAAQKLGVADDKILDHVVHYGLRVAVLAVDYLFDNAGNPSDQQFSRYCRLTTLDVQELIGKGRIVRPYLTLLKRATERADDLNPSKVHMWIKPEQLLVLKEDFERFREEQEEQDDADTPAAERYHSMPVASTKIKTAFAMRTDPKKSDAWWTNKMRDAKRNGLLKCRAPRGSGPQTSDWHPEAVAAWLTEKRRGVRYMECERAASLLRQHFPECADAADLIHPST